MDSTQCKNCPEGWVQPSKNQTFCTQCAQGKYSADDQTCQDCPVGFSGAPVFDEGVRICYSCAFGRYQSEKGQPNCAACPEGWIPSTESTQCTQCTDGKYSFPRNANWPGQTPTRGACVDSCPYASWANSTSRTCDVCAAGRYYTEDNQCLQCPVGYYKAEASVFVCTTCPKGYISNNSYSLCNKCNAGETTLQNTCTDCSAGKFEFNGMCYLCASGKYSDTSGRTNCSSCPEGRQALAEKTSCIDCEPGRFSTDDVDVCKLCPVGYGNTKSNSSACATCGTGSHTNNSGVCEKCSDGQYLEGEQCSSCPRGYEHTEERNMCNICEIGKYSSDGVECKDCDSQTNIRNGRGSWKCCQPGQQDCSDCAAGRYRFGEECIECPAGYVSKAAAEACVKCDDGYYQNATGQSECNLCLEGQEATFNGNCVNCPSGWSEIGFKCQECPRGWYSNEPSSTHTGNKVCTVCPNGRTTKPNTLGHTQDDCTVECKNYEIVDSFGECHFCGGGKYIFENKCKDCPLGWYKVTPIEKECTQCPAGYNTAKESQLACFVCETGECRCSWGEFLSNNGRCETCPAGYFSTGNDVCTGCGTGKYQDEQGQGSCKSCPAGKFEDTQRSIDCKHCAAGHFQPFVASRVCHDCPKGTYSGLGQEECTMCPEGSSTLELESKEITDCIACSAGTFESERVCTQCSEGLYQDEIGSLTCKSCPSAKWSEPGSKNESDCFSLGDLVTYTFGNIADTKPETSFTTSCELRANFVMLCPACTCDADSRNGFWSGPLCNECARGFATRFCTSICPGYDGIHDSTICNGNGRCWFGRQGNGLCYCGGKDVLDPSAEDVFVDVRYCPAGQICPGYGVEKLAETAYIPLYYLINYRQYTTFVLQMSQYTPERGHMWFKRYSPSKGYENACTTCTDKFSDTVITSVGYWSNQNEYMLFPTSAQSNTGFHGENCQYECAACLNGGECVHSPHPYSYSYTIEDTFRPQKSVNLPTTTCLCSSNVFDPANMCCPNGFQPYVYDGKRGTTPYSRYTTVPHVTAVDNDIGRGYYVDRDVYLETDFETPYAEPDSGTFVTTRGRVYDTNSSFAELGPYNKHVYHGTTKEICRACPGLFGKGVRAVGDLIETESEAENYWWNFPASAGSKKCNGQGVCDFYMKKREIDVDFMGSVNDWAMLHRSALCTQSIAPGRVKFDGENNEITTLEECVAYGVSLDASFVGWAPDYYLGGTDEDMIRLQDQIVNYGSPTAARDAAEITGAKAWAMRISQNGAFSYTVVADDMPTPDSDSVYRVYHTLEKRCVAYNTCIKIKSGKEYREFNIYTIERGRGEERLDTATFDRFDTCFTYTKNYDFVEDVNGIQSQNDIDDTKTSKRQKFGLYLTTLYTQGEDPFLGGQCPKGYFCSQNSRGTGFKEACPIGYYQPLEGQTRANKDVHCSRVKYNNANSCQPNLATKNISDYVDNVCIRCPRNSFSSAGAEICTECPSGRVKKISGSFDPANVDIFNIPTNTTPFWFYIPNEGGTRDDDCAVVPSSVLHVPTANDKMIETNDDNQFLPVISCPFGYSSQPGSYIIEDIWSLQNILQVDSDVMQAPYIYIDGSLSISAHDKPCGCIDSSQESSYYVPVNAEQCELVARKLAADDSTGIGNIDGLVDGLWHGCIKAPNSPYVQYNDNPEFVYNYPTNVKYICERIEKAETLIEEVVGAYCYPCPGDAMTGPGSGICSTCTANLIKKNMKMSLQKLIVNSEARMYYCNANGEAAEGNKLNAEPYTLDYNQLPVGCAPITLPTTITTHDIEYSKDILAWYYQKKEDRIWKPQHIFGAIQDPSMPGASIELTVSDCILACNTVFDRTYNFSDAVKPVRVGYARDEFERKYCMCNEGDGTADAKGVAENSEHTDQGTDCYNIVKDDGIINANCVPFNQLDVVWYESTIVDDWSKTEFPLCGLCSPGKYYNGAACLDCSAGQYTADMEQSMKDGCQFCPAGFYQDTTGNSGCLECRPGTYGPPSGSGLMRCKDCETGKHQDEYMMGACKNCPQGYRQNEEGSPECKICEPGRYENVLNSTATYCKSCPSGEYTARSGSIGCQRCPEGQYQDAGSQTSCKKCAVGKFASGTRQNSCTVCPPGVYQNEQGAIDCKSCRPDNAVDKCDSGDSCPWPDTAPAAGTSQYNDKSGQSKCKACPVGHTCSADIAPVRCRGGYAMPAGLYSKKCYKCPFGRYSTSDNGKCETCPLGHKTDSLRSSCEACPANHGTLPQNCGTDSGIDCTQCIECKKNEALVDHKCVPCCYGYVTLWEHDNQAGKSLVVPKTSYGSYTRVRDSIGNDRLTSITLNKGCRVVLYQHDGYESHSPPKTFEATSEVEDTIITRAKMVNGGFPNDVLSSFRVKEKSDREAQCTTAYKCQPNDVRLPFRNWGPTGCTSGNKCGMCQGDCDSDADCEGNLKCYGKGQGGREPRSITSFPIYCTGHTPYKWGYCLPDINLPIC